MISPSQIRGARAMLGLKQADLAEMAGISKTGLINIESGQADPKVSTLEAIRRALESVGVEFTNGGQPGVRLMRVEAKCAKCGYAGTVEHHLTRVSGVPTQCPTGNSPIACPEFRKAVSAANTALRIPNQEKAAKFAAKARGDRTKTAK
jgi:DNA-binding XRE family transcriptional regulator